MFGDKWDKQILLDHSDRLDLVAAFQAAFHWTGKRPLIVEGWQLRESVWRNAVLDLAAARADEAVRPKLFVIQPALELLLSLRARSKHEYHRRHATLADCVEQITIHAKMDMEQPWHGDVSRLATKEEAVEAVRNSCRQNEAASEYVLGRCRHPARRKDRKWKFAIFKSRISQSPRRLPPDASTSSTSCAGS
jgi:hypothetical protein